MGMIGSIVGGVTSAAGGIVAGKALSKGYRQQQEIFNKRIVLNKKVRFLFSKACKTNK